MSADGVLSVADLADVLKWDRRRAWEALRDIETRYPGVVTRRPHARGGRTLCGKANELVRYIPELRGKTPADQRLAALDNRLTELEQRLDAEVEARLEFQRKSWEWLARKSGAKKDNGS